MKVAPRVILSEAESKDPAPGALGRQTAGAIRAAARNHANRLSGKVPGRRFAALS